ncbi:protein CASC3 isoform X2 [Venturia canescens]|uniref:protein CASC3 isoform X2 n=1 Tax=Venturia canescens TaxID=32260 RepID=UPI001C9C3840|nr:protein CASC3 isoform X2 [Venturia canescens]
MSDTRRRRKQSGGSDDLSDSYELNATRETQSSEQTDGHRDSEYDTAGSEGDSDRDSQDGGERESGDGQEEDKPQRKLDDDEDRRNPQYIPKRGTFYEHDDRTTEEMSESTAEPPVEREVKEKKVWKDKEDKWNHDRYNDDEQAPKSHEELIAVYGYDIRNEEGPPRARRRRRYGRGPNKYTRNWEDEDAYGKTAPSITTGKNSGKRTNKNGEDFPALGGVNKDASTESVDEPVISSAWYSNKNKAPIKQQNFPPLQSQQDNNQKSKSGSSNTHTNENRAPNEPTNPAWRKEPKVPTRNLSPNRNVVNVVGSANVETEKLMNVKPVARDTKDVMKKRQVQESVSLAASKSRGRGFRANPNNNLVGGNRTIDLKPKGRGFSVAGVESKRNNAASLHENEQHQHLVNDTKHMSLNDGSFHPRQTKNFYVQSPGQQRPSTVPPRMQQQQQQQQHSQQHHQQQPLQTPEPQPQQVHAQQPDVAGNRPKRYSSLRQRPAIPEGPGQQQPPTYSTQHPQHGFYPPQGFPQTHFEQQTPVGNSPAPMAGQPVMPLTPGGQPSGYAPPPFLVPPPQFIPPQAAPPNIINYVSTPAGPAFPPNFQGYQGYNPTVQPQGPPPPPELFQPQGCTYYSPAQQQQQQGAPMRRPKAAIPILPPPDTSAQYQHHNHQPTMGRTKTSHHRLSAGSGNMSPMAQPLQPTTCQLAQPMIPQPSPPITLQPSQPIIAEIPQPVMPEILQSSEQSEPITSQTFTQQEVRDRQPQESDHKNSREILENLGPHGEATEDQLNVEKMQPVVEPVVAIESEISQAMNEPIAEIKATVEASNREQEIKNIAAEPPNETSSNEINVKNPEIETTQEKTLSEPPHMVENTEKIVVSPINIKNEMVVEQMEVKKTEIDVLPDQPVIEEAAA